MQNVGTLSIYREGPSWAMPHCHTQIRIRLNWIRLKIEDVYENEDDRKNENNINNLKKKDYQKNENNWKNADNRKNEDDPKNGDM